jgi:fructokinase
MNDANCFALSEAVDGSARGARVVFGVILGTGCGGGIVIDGAPLTGANAIAGDWGHNPLPWAEADERPGLTCSCGKQGCIETFLSGTGFAAHHNAAHGTALEAHEIVARADAGDAAAAASLARYENRLARALAGVINLLDPDAIVLGGGMSKTPTLYDRVPKLWGRWVFSDRVDTRLLPPRFGDSSGVRGAAWEWPAAAETRPWTKPRRYAGVASRPARRRPRARRRRPAAAANAARPASSGTRSCTTSPSPISTATRSTPRSRSATIPRW